MISTHIQSSSSATSTDQPIQMETNSPIYEHDSDLNCMTIQLNEKKYMFDYENFCKILNHKRNFIFTGLDEMYPSYVYNAKRINYLEFLYSDGTLENYKFINGNNFDLRQSNVKVVHKQSEYVYATYDVLEYIPGHYPTNKHSNIMKNPVWRVKIDGKEKIIMYCETDAFCILCPESYNKICVYERENCNGTKLTFHKGVNGYIMAHGSQNVYLTIHQIIMNHYGNGKGTKNASIDHIDRNPLNNSLDNLRISGHEEQQANKIGSLPGTKRARQHNARDLPEGIEHSMLRKYVVYYKEVYNKTKNLSREYFRVEHSMLSTQWESSKSCEISIIDKLNEANKVAANLENGIMPEKKERELPKYFRYEETKTKKYLVFDRRRNGERCNMRVQLNENADIEAELKNIRQSLIEKYDDKIFD